MGAWGYKIEECDEYWEVVETFNSLRDKGEPLSSIIDEIQHHYVIPDNPAAHIALLALLGCLNSIGYQELKALLQENIEWIISQDKQYWDCLCSDEALKKRRSAALLAYLGFTKKEIIQKKESDNNLKKGTCCWYKHKTHEYGIIILDVIQSDPLYLILLTENIPSKTKSLDNVLDAKLYTVAWFSESALLPPNRLHHIGEIIITKNYTNKYGLTISEDGGFFCKNIGQPMTWKHEFRSFSVSEITAGEFIQNY